MYFKNKKIKGKRYKYAVKSIRLPNGKVASLEVIYRNQNKEELGKTFEEKEKKKNLQYVIKSLNPDHILTSEELKKIEDMKIDYKRIIKNLSKVSLKDLIDRFTAN